MPALFCLALHTALDRVQAALPQGAHILAYLDDIYVVCDPGDVADIYDFSISVIEKKLKQKMLHRAFNKSEPHRQYD